MRRLKCNLDQTHMTFPIHSVNYVCFGTRYTDTDIPSLIAGAFNPALPHPSTVPPWTTTNPAASTPSSWSMSHQYPPQPPNIQLPVDPLPHLTIQHQLLSPPPSAQLQMCPTPHPTVQRQVRSTPPPVQQPVNPPPRPDQLIGLPPHQQVPEGGSTTTTLRDALDTVNDFYNLD